MRAAISLLVLLFSMCGAQTRSTQTEVQTESQSTGAAAAEVSTQLDVSAELRELRDMVVELRVLLTVTQNELQNTKAEMKTEVENLKKENAAQEAELTTVKTRLAVSEAEVMNLRKETAAQSADLRSVAERLAATETDMEQVKNDTAAQHTDLTTMKTEVMDLTKDNAALETRLAATVTDVEELKMDSAAHEQELAALKTRLAASETGIDDLKVENAAQEAELTAVKTRLAATETEVDNLETITEKSKVAFSVGLTDSGYVEAGNTELNLVFSKVITNAGQAYSSATGFFTAPVRGVYYFRFTVMDVLTSRTMNIMMYRNGQELMQLYEYNSDGQHAYLSGGLTLQLEVGDVVNLRIPAGFWLYDDSDNHCTFSGFLLFPL